MKTSIAKKYQYFQEWNWVVANWVRKFKYFLFLQIYNCLHHLGLTQSYTTALKNVDKLGNEGTRHLLKWKAQLQVPINSISPLRLFAYTKSGLNHCLCSAFNAHKQLFNQSKTIYMHLWTSHLYVFFVFFLKVEHLHGITNQTDNCSLDQS